MSKIKVVSKPERFRRAGIEFTREATVLDTATLTKEQVRQIESESMLVVVALPDEEKQKGGGKQ